MAGKGDTSFGSDENDDDNLRDILGTGNPSTPFKNDSSHDLGTRPIADLYSDCTILFADISGFTSWYVTLRMANVQVAKEQLHGRHETHNHFSVILRSSVREPTQVFQLLETLYSAFDQIARTRRIFKVETIGDCYVAVTGLPDPRKDHAIAMCRFASDILVSVL